MKRTICIILTIVMLVLGVAAIVLILSGCSEAAREICEGDAYYDIDIVKNVSMPACTSQKVINTKFL